MRLQGDRASYSGGHWLFINPYTVVEHHLVLLETTHTSKGSVIEHLIPLKPPADREYAVQISTLTSTPGVFITTAVSPLYGTEYCNRLFVCFEDNLLNQHPVEFIVILDCF